MNMEYKLHNSQEKLISILIIYINTTVVFLDITQCFVFIDNTQSFRDGGSSYPGHAPTQDRICKLNTVKTTCERYLNCCVFEQKQDDG
jgi:hypothetical protein